MYSLIPASVDIQEVSRRGTSLTSNINLLCSFKGTTSLRSNINLLCSFKGTGVIPVEGDGGKRIKGSGKEAISLWHFI